MWYEAWNNGTLKVLRSTGSGSTLSLLGRSLEPETSTDSGASGAGALIVGLAAMALAALRSRTARRKEERGGKHEHSTECEKRSGNGGGKCALLYA